jgi:hypothetical protein
MGLDNWKSSGKSVEQEEKNVNLKESLEILIERENPMANAAEKALEHL